MTTGSTINRIALATAAMLVCLAGGTTPSAAAPLTFTLSGQITPGQTSFTVADLPGLPGGATTETVNGVEYVGVSLWTFLNPLWTPSNVLAGSRIMIPSIPGANTNNPVLSSYIMATGADGHMSLISIGEMNPAFGGVGSLPPYLLAYKENGKDLDAPKLVVQDDPTGIRNVMDLDSIDVRSVPRPTKDLQAKGTPSTTLKLTGATSSAPYDLAKLQSFVPGPTTLSGVSFGGGAQRDYKGVLLWELLKSVGVGGVADILTSYFVATGSDGFEVVYSLGELNPAFHSPFDTPDLVAYAVSDTTNPPTEPVVYPKTTPPSTDGFARIVKPGDLKGGRYVSNLTSLQIVDTVPLPATLTLLLVGLVGMLPVVCRFWAGPVASGVR